MGGGGGGGGGIQVGGSRWGDPGGGSHTGAAAAGGGRSRGSTHSGLPHAPATALTAGGQHPAAVGRGQHPAAVMSDAGVFDREGLLLASARISTQVRDRHRHIACAVLEAGVGLEGVHQAAAAHLAAGGRARGGCVWGGGGGGGGWPEERGARPPTRATRPRNAAACSRHDVGSVAVGTLPLRADNRLDAAAPAGQRHRAAVDGAGSLLCRLRVAALPLAAAAAQEKGQTGVCRGWLSVGAQLRGRSGDAGQTTLSSRKGREGTCCPAGWV